MSDPRLDTSAPLPDSTFETCDSNVSSHVPNVDAKLRQRFPLLCGLLSQPSKCQMPGVPEPRLDRDGETGVPEPRLDRGIVDIFPNSTVAIEPLDNYPNPSRDFLQFILHMHPDSQTVYYRKSDIQNASRHLKSLWIGCRFRKEVGNISSSSIKRFMLPQGRRGYRIGNCFVVQPFFTFGHRTVPPGHRHVYQISDQPVMFYQSTTRHRDKSLFNRKDLLQYDKHILEPWSKYSVPPGVCYVVFTTHDSLFALDVVPVSVPLPFPCRDVSMAEKYRPSSRTLPRDPRAKVLRM